MGTALSSQTHCKGVQQADKSTKNKRLIAKQNHYFKSLLSKQISIMGRNPVPQIRVLRSCCVRCAPTARNFSITNTSISRLVFSRPSPHSFPRFCTCRQAGRKGGADQEHWHRSLQNLTRFASALWSPAPNLLFACWGRPAGKYNTNCFTPLRCLIRANAARRYCENCLYHSKTSLLQYVSWFETRNAKPCALQQ